MLGHKSLYVLDASSFCTIQIQFSCLCGRKRPLPYPFLQGLKIAVLCKCKQYYSLSCAKNPTNYPAKILVFHSDILVSKTLKIQKLRNPKKKLFLNEKKKSRKNSLKKSLKKFQKKSLEKISLDIFFVFFLILVIFNQIPQKNKS